MKALPLLLLLVGCGTLRGLGTPEGDAAADVILGVVRSLGPAGFIGAELLSVALPIFGYHKWKKGRDAKEGSRAQPEIDRIDRELDDLRTRQAVDGF